MKKKLKKELNKLLPEGVKVNKVLENYGCNDLHTIVLSIKKEPTKEQLLEKAERDYPEGTVFKCSWPKHMISEFISINKFTWWTPVQYNGDYPFGKNAIHSDNGYVWTEKYGWAKIIKSPVIKVQNKHLYEGDEYWELYKDNYVLKKQVAQKGISEHYETKEFERFSTKEAALDYVIAEVIKQPAKKYYLTRSKDDRDILIRTNFFGESKCMWTEDKGFLFLAEPVKETPLMLGDYEVEIGEQLIACNDGSVTKKEWLKCMNIFIPIISKTEANEINIDIGGDYEAVFKLLNSGEILTNGPNYSIKLGCIPRVTIEQIQAITDKLNEV